MKIRYENTMDDIVAFNRHHANHSPYYLAVVTVFLAVPAVIFLVLGVLGLIVEDDLGCLAMGVAFGVGWPVLFWLLLRWRLGATVRRLVHEGANRTMLCWHELELADGALTERTDQSSHTVALRTVEKIQSSDTHTFIFFSAMGAYVIPQRDLAEEEYRGFVEAVRREWEQARQH